ncbi:hypothetical protein V8E36_001828 [Tilletia maclaganii]
MAPRTVKTSHGEPIGPLQAAEILRARRIAKGKAPLTPEEEANEAARQAGQATAADALPLGKVLASTEKRVRDGAIRSLAQFLSRPSTNADVAAAEQADPSSPASSTLIPPAEMAKLWKGIFYCFWMSDKPLVQQALATELAELVILIAKPAASKKKRSAASSEGSSGIDLGRVDSALAFLQGFWAAMAREWPLIDKHRVDKYYLLMRRFVGAGFRLCQAADWNTSVVSKLNAVLITASPTTTVSPAAADSTNSFDQGGPGPLAVHDIKHPDSISYHVVDLWLDELSKVLSTPAGDAPSSSTQEVVPIALLLQPVFVALANSTLPKMYERIMEASVQPVLDDVQKAIDLLDAVAGGDDQDDDGPEEDEDRPVAGLRGAAKGKEPVLEADESRDEDFELDELWEGLERPSIIQATIAFDAESDDSDDEDDTGVTRPAKRVKVSNSGLAGREDAGPGAPSAETLLSRARQSKIDILLALRAASRGPAPPAHPARTRSIEKYVLTHLSPEDDPEPRPEEDAALTSAQRKALEKKKRIERAKARILRKKRNVEMQAAIQRKAASRKAAKAKVASARRSAAAKARAGLDGPVVVGPALSRKVGRSNTRRK